MIDLLRSHQMRQRANQQQQMGQRPIQFPPQMNLTASASLHEQLPQAQASKNPFSNTNAQRLQMIANSTPQIAQILLQRQQQQQQQQHTQQASMQSSPTPQQMWEFRAATYQQMRARATKLQSIIRELEKQQQEHGSRHVGMSDMQWEFERNRIQSEINEKKQQFFGFVNELKRLATANSTKASFNLLAGVEQQGNISEVAQHQGSPLPVQNNAPSGHSPPNLFRPEPQSEQQALMNAPAQGSVMRGSPLMMPGQQAGGQMEQAP
ncbi:uncharacterized protein LAESUDRAFT_199385 [Laetiporus sulphureus 93-53]|uniref:Uncharacterized protein n=1 Tax=Laetiporus sulphureus 93-53 TaxID=1314785 RepID=A0A165E2P2_9APHY|nr:uncharacterized protein LAESUDRAFT_199385 [Laetiporus sulphureus 93-53]KZT06130.1 hypothetical protein LAESUDRAFT_199385 [Laetiporus sulphureus 93-53]